ncbi:MAG: SAM-dependent methyltransferase [Clostridiales bacterium]|nr:SAM-dependent methyltransferase [Clostridiales bacterium]
MAKKEANFDAYMQTLLNEASISFTCQGSDVFEIAAALKTASKNQKGNKGYPEFTAVVNGFVLVMEDKTDRSKLRLDEADGSLSKSVKATTGFALNGALHYASLIAKNTNFKKIFAFGGAGDSKHHVIKPIFVNEQGEYKELPEIETFENFSPENIDEYYKAIVLGEIPAEEIEVEQIKKDAEELHEYLQGYGKIGEKEKPLVVSAILLALRDTSFRIDDLTGNQSISDGKIILNHLSNYLVFMQVDEGRRRRLLGQYNFIQELPALNNIEEQLGKTPLRFFTEFVNNKFHRHFNSDSTVDFLGILYSEFIKYTGGDGQGLGIVLTPSHITKLFCDLVELSIDDVVLDPCCGTAGFLVAAMNDMLSKAASDDKKTQIMKDQIFGIECDDKMFTLATANMILRGDGKSNLIFDDFLKIDAEKIKLLRDPQLAQSEKNKIAKTVGFMNPPYSLAQKLKNPNLSELCYIRQLLNSIARGGKAVAIVPIAAMIGKTKEDKEIKKEILKAHTLEGVISLNKSTFHGIGVVPCIAVWTTGAPHPAGKKVKFINFEDDGYEVKKHLGLVKTERAKDRKQLLLDCWHGKNTDAYSEFMVETEIKATDEWVHSFYYYNDEIPMEDDFMKSIADYLTFEFNMIAHGRGYLFGEGEGHA